MMWIMTRSFGWLGILIGCIGFRRRINDKFFINFNFLAVKVSGGLG